MSSDSAELVLNRPAPGFHGIWYGNQLTGPPYHWKYSGAMATYPQQHAPIAIYRSDVQRTYFVFGGSDSLQPACKEDWKPGGSGGEHPGDTFCCISFFDHTTGELARPIELLRRNMIDAHENPVLCIDPDGYLLVFCPAHGWHRPSYLLRSVRPHDITAFELVREWPINDNFSYPQPWWLDAHGLVFLHTFYEQNRRRLGVITSPDGVDWSAWGTQTYLSKMAEGSYQISWPGPDGIVATAFDQHPPTKGDSPLNRRTNLYYAQSRDGGRTWQTADGQPLKLPLTDIDNPALVLDAAAQGRLVYLKDLQFDATGRPVIAYLTSASAWPGPESGPYEWWIARYCGDGSWSHHRIDAAQSDHNYDHGSLYLLADDDWRLLAPTRPGPQAYATGGTMCLLQSRDGGTTWTERTTVVNDAKHNHTYARRPPHAHRDFAWLWGAANSYFPGPTQMFFSDADGRAFVMPREMTSDRVKPTPAESE